MSETEFTPGPWEAEQLATSAGYVWRVGPFHACIYVDRGGACNENLSDAEGEADARLIAAAPDLYEALSALLDDTQHAAHKDCAEGPCPVRDARDALAKARGAL